MTNIPLKYWKQFVASQKIYKTKVPLFKSDAELSVQTKKIGTTKIPYVLQRNEAMEKRIIEATNILKDDWEGKQNRFDGLIYMMFKITLSEGIIPLYIGKTETMGKRNGNLSVNITNLTRDKSKFARWGDNYAYHIGDLSAVAVKGHPDDKKTIKYKAWAESLFKKFPASNPQLKEEVFFWTKPWKKDDVGIWKEFGSTRLTFLEYLLIGVASSAFPSTLLNVEGQNR